MSCVELKCIVRLTLSKKSGIITTWLTSRFVFIMFFDGVRFVLNVDFLAPVLSVCA